MRPRKPKGQLGTRPATLEDVAAAVGVSTSTVSRVFRGLEIGSELTRARVQVAINALGYVPNAHARSLKHGANLKVGLLSSIRNDAYLIKLLEGALDEAAELNVQLLFRRDLAKSDPVEQARALLKMGVNGFVVTPPFAMFTPLIDWIASSGVECVLIGDRTARLNLPAVGIDNEAAAYEMTSHLLGLGHRDIGFIIGDVCHTASRHRLQGYRRALEEYSITPRSQLEAQGYFTHESGFEAAQKLLSGDRRPTAIFASNDDMAVGAIAAAAGLGIRVPDDLTVCGFDDTAMAAIANPPLTTVRQPLRALAGEALRLLRRRLSKAPHLAPEPPHQILLDFELVHRESCAPPGNIASPSVSSRLAALQGAGLSATEEKPSRAR